MTGPDAARDATLVARARLGDQSAFAELVDRHLDDLHDHAVRITGDPSTDLAVGTFRQVVDRLGALEDPERFRPWLYSIAGEELAATPRGAPPNAANGNGTERAVLQAVAGLPLVQARALDLVARRGMDVQTAKAALGGNAARHYDRAVRALSGEVTDPVTAYASLPAHLAPPTQVVLDRVLPRWSASPPPPERSSHHGLVVWGAATAAVLLGLALPAAAGMLPVERSEEVAPAEYTAAPYTEAAGVTTPRPDEPEGETLPPLPTFGSQRQEETTQNESAPTTPEPTPTTEPSPTERPTPTEEPSEECTELLQPLCPSEDPSSESPPPSETTESETTSPSPSPPAGGSKNKGGGGGTDP